MTISQTGRPRIGLNGSTMQAQRFQITEKRREFPIRIAAPEDFGWKEVGTFDAARLIGDPRFSLYCLDLPRQSALFVEVDDYEAMIAAPFLYQAQSDQAVGLASIPLADLHELAEKIAKPERGFVFLHSVGRCGSTLLSKVFQSLPATLSLSEPDEPTFLGQQFAQQLLPVDEVRHLLWSSTMWRAKSVGKPIDRVAIKYRSEVMLLSEMFGDLFPDDAHIFQYRDGRSWIRSVVRGWRPETSFDDEERNSEMANGWAKSNPLVREFAARQKLDAAQIRFLSWVNWMEHYQKLRKRVDAVAIRYEDLVATPEPILYSLFEKLAISDPDWQAIREVFARDSQAGTIFDREQRKALQKEIPDQVMDGLQEIVSQRPLLGSFDVTLPGTIDREAEQLHEIPSSS